MAAKTECHPDRMNLERLAARAFVVGGGIFWVIAAFAAPYVYGRSGATVAIQTAIYPFVATAAILVIGWTYERMAAVLLLAGAAGVAVWGVLFGWELGVWILMSTVLIAPITIAAVLFLLASRMQEVCSLPQPAQKEQPVPAPSQLRA